MILHEEQALLFLHFDDSEVVAQMITEQGKRFMVVPMERFVMAAGNYEELAGYKLKAKESKLIDFLNDDASDDTTDAFYHWASYEERLLNTREALAEENRHSVDRARVVSMVRLADAMVDAGHLPVTWDDWDASDGLIFG